MFDDHSWAMLPKLCHNFCETIFSFAKLLSLDRCDGWRVAVRVRLGVQRRLTECLMLMECGSIIANFCRMLLKLAEIRWILPAFDEFAHSRKVTAVKLQPKLGYSRQIPAEIRVQPTGNSRHRTTCHILPYQLPAASYRFRRSVDPNERDTWRELPQVLRANIPNIAFRAAISNEKSGKIW